MLLKGSGIKRTSRRTVLLKGSGIKRTSRRTVLLKGSGIKRTSRRTVLLKGSGIKRTSRRTVLLKGSGIKRTSRRTVLLKGSDIKRTSRRTALLKGRNTRTIQLPLRHLKGIGIGMTPLSDWLNVLPRGSGIAGVTELHYTTQWYVMACCIALALKSYRKMCMQHVYSTHVRICTKPFTSHVMVTQLLSFLLSIEYWGVILNLIYKNLQLCMNLIAFARVEH